MKTLFLFSKEESATKVANNRLFSYAAGLAGQNMTYNYISNRLFVFLNTLLKIPSEKTGIITGVSTIWDAINDPLVGSIMDNRKHKPGNKMRPFLLWTPIIIGIMTVLMFTDFGLTQSQTVGFIFVVYMLFDLFYSFQDIAIWGLSALTSPDSTERGRVTQWISIGAGAGATIAGLFPMIKQMVVDSGVMTEKNAYFAGAVLFGAGGMLISMLSYRMKEKVRYVAPEKTSIIKSIWNLRHNKTLIILCVARIVQSFSLSLPWEYFFESEGIGYNVFGAQITGGTAQVLFGVVSGIPGAFCVFFAMKIIKKVGGNKNLLVYSEIAAIAARLVSFIIGANNRYMNIAPMLIFGFLVGCSQILTNLKDIAMRSLLTNSVDEIELKTGERTEGIVFSMQNLVSKLIAAIPKFIQGYFLKFLGFNENLGTGGNDTIKAQTSPRFLKYRWHQFVLGPVIGSVLFIIVILFLKDNKEHVADVEQRLKEKREAMYGKETAETVN